MYQTYQLSHDDAMTIVLAIRQSLEAQGKAATIAVADAHGELLAFLRMDGCSLAPGTIAINKAYTAARERKETKAIGTAAREEGYPMTNFGDLRYVGWGGGVPIFYQGQIVGAVGVSGLPEADDIVAAKAGIAALPGVATG
jgi:glc operon protein GlcG